MWETNDQRLTKYTEDWSSPVWLDEQLLLGMEGEIGKELNVSPDSVREFYIQKWGSL